MVRFCSCCACFASPCKSSVFSRVLCLTNNKKWTNISQKSVKHMSKNKPRKATRAPRRAFSNEKQSNEIIQKRQCQNHPTNDTKNHDNPEQSIESKAPPQPEIDIEVDNNGFQMAQKRKPKNPRQRRGEPNFSMCFEGLRFPKHQPYLNYYNKLQIGSLRLQTEPEKPREPRGEHFQSKNNARR